MMGKQTQMMAQMMSTVLIQQAARARKRPKPRGDKYAPCPCGSGKKYKFCCWSCWKGYQLKRAAEEIERLRAKAGEAG